MILYLVEKYDEKCRCNAGGTAVERRWNAVERGGTQGTEVSDRFLLGFFGTQTIGAFARRCLSRLEMSAASESR